MTCPHGMPSPPSCVSCMEDGPAAPPNVNRPPTVEATFRARYDGHCNGCNLAISVGQVVHRLSDERYVHAGCQP